MKKIYKHFVSLVIACFTAFSILGCSCFNKPNDEFEEFKTIITTILNQYEGENGVNNGVSYIEESKPSVHLLVSSTNKLDQIKNMVNGDSNKSVIDASYYYQDAFEQAFYIPLIAGDVYAYTLKKDGFYGKKMYFETNNQYIVVESNGNYKYVYCYTPATDRDSESYTVLVLNYESSQKYEFSMMTFNNDYSDISYIYGNNSKDMIAIGKSSDNHPDHNYVVVTIQEEAYESLDSEILARAYPLISQEITSQDKNKIKGLSSGKPTTIPTDAYYEVMSKYFGDTTGKVNNSMGYVDEEGKVLGLISCKDGVVTIPSSIRYLNKELDVNCDSSNVVVNIPATIQGIKMNDDGNIIDVDPSGFSIRTFQGVTLTDIVVEEGSTIFKSGNGHLQTIDGKYAHYLNLALPGGVLDANVALKDPEFKVKLMERPNLANSIHTINYTFDENAHLLIQLTSALRNLRTMNLSGVSENTNLELVFITTNLTTNIDVEGRIYIRADFESAPTKNMVNILNESVRLEYATSSSIIELSVPWEEAYFDENNMIEMFVKGVNKENIVFKTTY